MDRRTFISLLGGGVLGTTSGCGIFEDCLELPEGCTERTNITNVIDGITVEAPAADQEMIASHLQFLRQFSGDNAVNLIHTIVVYDSYAPSCDPTPDTCSYSIDFRGMGGFTHVSPGNIYIHAPNQYQSAHYWPSKFRLPFTLNRFTDWDSSYGAVALAHELNHNLTAHFFDEEDLRKKYYPEMSPSDFNEYLPCAYSHFAEIAYLISSDLPSSPVFDQFLFPSLEAGEVTAEEVHDIVKENYFPEFIRSYRRLEYLNNRSMFFETGMIKPEFEELFGYYHVAEAFIDVMSRWRHHADAVLDNL